MDAFQRVTSAGEFRVTNFPASTNSSRNKKRKQGKEEEEEDDHMAPSRITDLHVLRLYPDSGQATVRWTAVGDDMDRGTAYKYVIQISENFDELFGENVNDTAWTENDGDLMPQVLYPQAAGEIEEVNLTLNNLEENMTLCLSLRAVDESNNVGDLSNIITLSRARVLAVPIEHVDYRLEFYLKLILPPMAALVVFVGFAILVMKSRRAVSKDMDDLGKDSEMSVSTLSLDLSFMNYRHEGQYRQRLPEDLETWSDLGKSRDSLDKL